MIALFGAGEIAERGIVPIVGGTVVPKDRCDVRRYNDVYAQMEDLHPDVVVFTAAVSHPDSVTGGGVRLWRDEVETNLLGGYHVAKAAAGHGATMVLIASLAGLYGKPNHSGYSASKAGLISLVQSLAMEGHNAYAISPGRVDTGMRERDYPGEDPQTRLDPILIGLLVKDILDGKFTPGDNLVIRMSGHDVLPLEIHRGDGWAQRLKVGQPKTW